MDEIWDVGILGFGWDKTEVKEDKGARKRKELDVGKIAWNE